MSFPQNKSKKGVFVPAFKVGTQWKIPAHLSNTGEEIVAEVHRPLVDNIRRKMGVMFWHKEAGYFDVWEGMALEQFELVD